MTHWPVASSPIPSSAVPTAQLYYQSVCSGRDDSVFVWGTDVDVQQTQAYLREVNETSNVLVSLPHVLLRSVGCALREHPEFNRRLAGKKLYQYHDANLMVPARDAQGETQVLVIEQADRLTIGEIAETVWNHLAECNAPDAHRNSEVVRDANIVRTALRPFIPWMQKLHSRFNLGPLWGHTRLRKGGVYVNSLDFRGAPPMTSYKPSRFPSDMQLTSITQGPVRPQVMAVDGQPVVRNMAPLIVRADHRAVDAFQLGEFVATLRRYFSNPRLMDEEHGPQAETLQGGTNLAATATARPVNRVPVPR